VEAPCDALESFEVLQGHGLLIDGLGGGKDLLKGYREAFALSTCACFWPSAPGCGLFSASLRMAACFSPSATLMAASRVRSIPSRQRGDALGRHLLVHGILDVLWRDDLADLDVGDLDTQRSVTSSSFTRKVC